MPNKQLKAFSLVEVLVTILLSSIVIAGAYSSYQMVDLQYIKNKEISDMHTQGRAVIRILERDIRMAGFEYRDKNGNIVKGGISKPIEINNRCSDKCRDEITIIYDYYDEELKKLERIKTKYYYNHPYLMKNQSVLFGNRWVKRSKFSLDKMSKIDNLQFKHSTLADNIIDIAFSMKTTSKYNFRFSSNKDYISEFFSSAALVRNMKHE